MVHVVGALMSRIIAYLINFCAHIFVRMADPGPDPLGGDMYDELRKSVAENVQIISELEMLNVRIQNMLRRNCTKNHHGNLLLNYEKYVPDQT